MQVWEIERSYYFSMLVFSSRTDKAEIGKDRIKRPVPIQGKERWMRSLQSYLRCSFELFEVSIVSYFR